jgi:hypothetical protein
VMPGRAISQASATCTGVDPTFVATASRADLDRVMAPRIALLHRNESKRREASTVIVLADFGIGWIAQLSLLTSAKLDVGLCSASSMTRPPDVD